MDMARYRAYPLDLNFHLYFFMSFSEQTSLQHGEAVAEFVMRHTHDSLIKSFPKSGEEEPEDWPVKTFKDVFVEVCELRPPHSENDYALSS